MADLAVASMSGWGVKDTGVREGRVDWRARFAGSCDAPGALRVAVALSLFGPVRRSRRDSWTDVQFYQFSAREWTATFSTNSYAEIHNVVTATLARTCAPRGFVQLLLVSSSPSSSSRRRVTLPC